MSTFEVKTQAEIDALSLDTSAKGRAYFNDTNGSIVAWDGSNWRGYESDGVFYDFSGSNSNSGEFDGVGDYVDFGTIAELNSATNYSITAWLRWNDFDGGTGSFPIASGSSTTQRLAWYATSNTVKFYVGNTITITSSSLSTDTWYHFAYVKNGTTAILYIDSSVDGTGTAAATTPTSGANNFAVGTAAAFTGYYFDGYVDEVAVFDYALTNAQVSSIYSNKKYFNPLSVWRFENGVTDETGNYNGTNNGVTFSPSVKPY